VSPSPRREDLWSRLFASRDARRDLTEIGPAAAWAIASILVGLLDGTTDPASVDVRPHPTDPGWRLVDVHGYVVACRRLAGSELAMLGGGDGDALYVAQVVRRDELRRRLDERTPDD
jgi:hypothetical protein